MGDGKPAFLRRHAPLRPARMIWPSFVGATVLLLIGLPKAPAPYNEKEILIAAVGGVWALAFFLHDRQKEDAQFMKELFEYFNDRYNKINEKLKDALREGALGATREAVIVDYFNLCAEEWVFWKLGCIYDPVWESWLNGMREYGKDERVATLWVKERTSNSYYGFEFPIGVPSGR